MVKINLFFQSKFVKCGSTSRAVHAESHKSVISSITEAEIDGSVTSFVNPDPHAGHAYIFMY
jgi:hypothetical protein